MRTPLYKRHGNIALPEKHGNIARQKRHGIIALPKQHIMKKLCHYIAKYMGVLVLAAALLALAFPGLLSQVRPTVINYLLGIIMFGMGMALNLRDFKIVFRQPKDIFIGCMAQFTVMPLLAVALSRVFALDEALSHRPVLGSFCCF